MIPGCGQRVERRVTDYATATIVANNSEVETTFHIYRCLKQVGTYTADIARREVETYVVMIGTTWNTLVVKEAGDK